MKVLHLITNLDPDGAQTALLDLLRFIPGPSDSYVLGYLVGRPLALDDPPPTGFQIIDLSRAGRPDPFLIGRLIRLLRRMRCEIVHTHLVHAGIAGKLGATLAGSIPVVTTRHYASDDKEGTFLYRVEDRLTRHCAAVIAVSDAVRAHLIERNIVMPERVVTIPNGVDLQRFDPAVYRPNPERRVNAPKIGTVGRLHPQKGQSVGLRAFASILQRHPEATLEIIGSGGLRKALDAEARRLGVSEHVFFLGSVPHAEIARRMSCWDLAIFPSLWEGFGVAVAEAMAMEVPVVASRVEGLREVVDDGKTGILVPAGDPSALAEASIRLLSDPAAAAEMGRMARGRVASRFSVQSGAERTRGLYDAILDRV